MSSRSRKNAKRIAMLREQGESSKQPDEASTKDFLAVPVEEVKGESPKQVPVASSSKGVRRAPADEKETSIPLIDIWANSQNTTTTPITSFSFNPELNAPNFTSPASHFSESFIRSSASFQAVGAKLTTPAPPKVAVNTSPIFNPPPVNDEENGTKKSVASTTVSPLTILESNTPVPSKIAKPEIITPKLTTPSIFSPLPVPSFSSSIKKSTASLVISPATNSESNTLVPSNAEVTTPEVNIPPTFAPPSVLFSSLSTKKSAISPAISPVPVSDSDTPVPSKVTTSISTKELSAALTLEKERAQTAFSDLTNRDTNITALNSMLNKAYTTIKSHKVENERIEANELVITRLRQKLQEAESQLEIRTKTINEDKGLLGEARSIIKRLQERLLMETAKVSPLEAENEELRFKVAALEQDKQHLVEVEIPAREADVEIYKDKADKALEKYNAVVQQKRRLGLDVDFLGSQISELSDIKGDNWKGKGEEKGKEKGKGKEGVEVGLKEEGEEKKSSRERIKELENDKQTLKAEKRELTSENEIWKMKTAALERERDGLRDDLQKTVKEKEKTTVMLGESKDVLMGRSLSSEISDALKKELGGEAAMKRIKAHIAASPVGFSKEMKEKNALIKNLQDRLSTAETSLEEETHQKNMLNDQIDDMRHEIGRFNLDLNATADKELVPFRRVSLSEDLMYATSPHPEDDELMSTVQEDSEDEEFTRSYTPGLKAAMTCDNLLRCNLQALVDSYRLMIFVYVAILENIFNFVKDPRGFYKRFENPFLTATTPNIPNKSTKPTPINPLPSLHDQIRYPLRGPRQTLRRTLINLIIQLLCVIFVMMATQAMQEKNLWLAANDVTRRMVIEHRNGYDSGLGFFTRGGILEGVEMIPLKVALRFGYEMRSYAVPG